MRAILALIAAVTVISVASPDQAKRACTTAATPHVRTTLYFGLSLPTADAAEDSIAAHTISETQWEAFLRDQVTPRFPAGLTVVEATGQWREATGVITHERSKVLTLLHQDTPEARNTLADLVAIYKRTFHQESVLWESAPVCAGF
jgi:hypothetical protein